MEETGKEAAKTAEPKDSDPLAPGANDGEVDASNLDEDVFKQETDLLNV